MVVFLFIVVAWFFGFHCHLIVEGYTTVEWCEKRAMKGQASDIILDEHDDDDADAAAKDDEEDSEKAATMHRTVVEASALYAYLLTFLLTFVLSSESFLSFFFSCVSFLCVFSAVFCLLVLSAVTQRWVPRVTDLLLHFWHSLPGTTSHRGKCHCWTTFGRSWARTCGCGWCRCRIVVAARPVELQGAVQGGLFVHLCPCPLASLCVGRSWRRVMRLLRITTWGAVGLLLHPGAHCTMTAHMETHRTPKASIFRETRS